jgi:hypothetical protein
MEMHQEKFVTWDGVEYGLSVGTRMAGDGNMVGWFELYDVKSGGGEYYAEGGLWFEDDSYTLCDYDGVYTLPKPVCDALRDMGFDPSYAEEYTTTPIERNEHGDEFVVGCAKCGNDVYEVNEKGLCNECVNL